MKIRDESGKKLCGCGVLLGRFRTRRLCASFRCRGSSNRGKLTHSQMRRALMEIATLNLTLGTAQRRFRYRRGSGDEGAVVQALKNSGYNFGPLRCANELSEFYRRLIRAGKTPLIVDAGARIGASTVYFACSFPAARIVAIEPDRGSFELLRANAADLPVKCVQAAVAPSSAAQPVTCVAIDDVYERNGQDAVPFIVKLDIDRCEGSLFAARAEWAERTPVIIVRLSDALIPGTESSRAFVDYAAGCSRDFVYLHDNIFSIDRDLIARGAHDAAVN
jgi:hypothetical protein